MRANFLGCLISGICIGCSSEIPMPEIRQQKEESLPKLELIVAKTDNATLPLFYLDKVEAMPDYYQMQQGLPASGSQYCGPASAANALIWLDSNGFGDMVEGDANNPQARLNLVKMLGDNNHMHTGNSGTPVCFLMHGLEKYIKERGYEVIIQHKGSRGYRADKHAGDLIDVPWLMESITGSSNVILNVGFYKYDKGNDRYLRLVGHYVSVAGYDFREGCQLVIHDPSPRSGKEAKHEHCSLAAIESGRLVERFGEKEKVRDSKGCWILKGLSLKKGSSAAVIDSAVRFGVSQGK
jgi:hypothetical protein